MLNAISRANLMKTPLTRYHKITVFRYLNCYSIIIHKRYMNYFFRSLPAFSTCNVNFKAADAVAKKEATRIDNETALMLPEQRKQKKAMAGKISVPVKVCSTVLPFLYKI